MPAKTASSDPAAAALLGEVDAWQRQWGGSPAERKAAGQEWERRLFERLVTQGGDLPADILGQVHERLGRSEALNRAGKKAAGVYYTPCRIVDYIVRETLAPLLAGKTPAEAAQLRILDPACGCGAFLLGAYQFLLDWHAEHAARNEPSGKLRSAILQNNLFGVDLDPAAVEITRRSLLLKLRNGGDGGSAAWPDLSRNIRCGNALVEPDFFPLEVELPSDERREQVKAFCWTEAFSEVLQAGGFDAVVFNPPYVNVRLLTQSLGPEIKEYFRRTYVCAERGYDLYVLFIERAWHLLRDEGRWGMIVPNKLATLDYARRTRSLLCQQTSIEQIVNMEGCRAFREANVYPYVLVGVKSSPAAGHAVRILQLRDLDDLQSKPAAVSLLQADLDPVRGFRLPGTFDPTARVPTLPLGELAKLHSGTAGFVAQQMAAALHEAEPGVSDEAFHFIVSGNIDRYRVRLGNVRFMKRVYPLPRISQEHPSLSSRKRLLFAGKKIVIAGMSRRLEAAFDPGGLALGVQVFAAAELKLEAPYLLGVLNSKLLSYLFCTRFPAKRLASGYFAINLGQLASLPIRQIDRGDAEEKSRHDGLVNLVEQMQRLRSSATAERVCDEIESLDRQIDQCVHELYALTPQEIGEVERYYEPVGTRSRPG